MHIPVRHFHKWKEDRASRAEPTNISNQSKTATAAHIRFDHVPVKRPKTAQYTPKTNELRKTMAPASELTSALRTMAAIATQPKAA